MDVGFGTEDLDMVTLRGWIGRTAQPGCSCEPRLVLPETGADVSRVRRGQRQDTFELAARLATKNRAIRRVHVVLSERPGYDEIAGYRLVAEDGGLDMSVDGTGMVSLRPRAVADPAVGAGQARRGGTWS